MNNFLKILMLCLTFLFFSCSSKSESKNDSDATSDADSDLIETVDDDSYYQDSDFIDDSDANDTETDDSDSDTDEPIDVDYQGAEDCPKLSEAKFPYYNDDKSIHFCRKCDTPTVKDPQCMENLWKEEAAKLYAVSPESECKNGYPCEMTGLKPASKAEWDEEFSKYQLPYEPHECDVILSARSVSNHDVWSTDSTAGSFKHFDVSEGKIGIKLENRESKVGSYATISKVMIYDPSEKKYKAVAPMTADMLAYHKGCFLFMGTDFRTYKDNYLFYACEDGSRRVVYPRKIHWLSYTPALSKKWAIANIQEEEGSLKYTMYAKVGEWKWTKLMEGLSYGPQIVNDKTVFYNDSFKAYYCDLSKNPQSVDECVLVNETDEEEIRSPRINDDDETEIIYESDISEISIKRLKIETNGKKEYSLILNTYGSSDNNWKGFAYGIRRVNQKFIFYNEFMIYHGEQDGNPCFYNRETKKSICMKKVNGMQEYYFGYDDWEDKWLLYQFLGVALQAVRDLDCYCEKEGVCPFAE